MCTYLTEFTKSIFILRPKQRMVRGKSRNLYKNKNKGTRKQRGAGGCWGGICSTNNPPINETAHNPQAGADNTFHMVQNPMFKGVDTPRLPESQPPENVQNPIASLTWLWTTAEYRFTEKYPIKYHDFNFTQGQAIDYLHGKRDILREVAYTNVIFVLKLEFLNKREIHEFLERASSDIETLTQAELDYLNNLIVKKYKNAEIKNLKDTILKDFKTTSYTYNASILEPANKPYTAKLTNLFERLVVSPARSLLTRLERDLQPAGTNVAALVEEELMRIRTAVKNSVDPSILRGGRSRKNNLRKTRKNKQRGSGKCRVV